MRQQAIILLIVSALAGVWNGRAQEPWKITDGDHAGFYGSVFDTARVWHPERILIQWRKTQLDILLPREEELSGVSNLFFRVRSSGEVRMLDSVKDNPTYGKRILDGISSENKPIFCIDSIKHRRYANRLGPGSYDAILLYNSGKYVTFENVVFTEGMTKVVDMTGQPVMEADEDSCEWLGLRKFTDIVGERVLKKNYTATSPHKIIGYLFFPNGRADNIYGTIGYNNTNKIVAVSSFDGFFEVDVDSDGEAYPLKLFFGPSSITVEAKANTWIFAVPEPEPHPTMKM